MSSSERRSRTQGGSNGLPSDPPRSGTVQALHEAKPRIQEFGSVL